MRRYKQRSRIHIIDRIIALSVLIPESECWYWIGTVVYGRGQKRYGRLWDSTSCRKVLAHRAAWEAVNREKIPDGEEGSHRCGNSLCCNPAHIVIESHLENMKRIKKHVREKRV